MRNARFVVSDRPQRLRHRAGEIGGDVDQRVLRDARDFSSDGDFAAGGRCWGAEFWRVVMVAVNNLFFSLRSACFSRRSVVMNAKRCSLRRRQWCSLRGIAADRRPGCRGIQPACACGVLHSQSGYAAFMSFEETS